MPTLASMLEANGFRVRHNRADCAFCTGHTRLTVAFNEARGVAYCHRCQWRGTLRSLAKIQGIVIPPRKPGLAKLRIQKFRSWLLATMAAMATQERQLAKRAELAKKILIRFPDTDSAWNALAKWYHAQRKFETFWQAASDNIGRKELYLMWRTHGES